jgi:hypothetical protein
MDCQIVSEEIIAQSPGALPFSHLKPRELERRRTNSNFVDRREGPTKDGRSEGGRPAEGPSSFEKSMD